MGSPLSQPGWTFVNMGLQVGRQVPQHQPHLTYQTWCRKRRIPGKTVHHILPFAALWRKHGPVQGKNNQLGMLCRAYVAQSKYVTTGSKPNVASSLLPIHFQL